jgi:hypothetical protein
VAVRTYATIGLFFLLVLLGGYTASGAAESWTGALTLGSWKLASTSETIRWVLIRRLPTPDDPLYHVEVLERAKGAPSWRFSELASHLAVTDAALRRSVLSKIKLLEPYPESYEAAYARWLGASDPSQRTLCDKTVLECLG